VKKQSKADIFRIAKLNTRCIYVFDIPWITSKCKNSILLLNQEIDLIMDDIHNQVYRNLQNSDNL